MTTTDRCRFCRLYVIAVLAFAVLEGGLFALGFMITLDDCSSSAGTFLGQVLHAGGPAVGGSALLLALVLWAHPLPVSQLQADLPRILRRGALIALPGYLVASGVAVLTGSCVAHLVVGCPWSELRMAYRHLAAADLLLGARSTLFDTALILFLTWRFLVRLQTGRMSLPAKLIVVLTTTVALRATFGLIAATLASR